MPANLSADFLKAENKYRAAVSNEDKLACLEEMFTTLPKHKGTEKMQADIKTKISKLKKEMAAPSKGGAKRADWFHVEKQGAGQVAVIGAPNCGKSALVKELTGLNTEVAAYPFTTTQPLAGMMPFEGVQVQLIDTPPISPDSPAWLFHIMRTSDMLLWLIDLSDDAVLETVEQTTALLAQARIACVSPKDEVRSPKEEPEATPATAIDKGTASDAARQPETANPKKTIRLGAKADDPQALDRLAILREMIGDVEVMLVSVEKHTGLEELKRKVFESLNIIRVYTKKPGKQPDFNDPVVLPIGATITDAAYHLHKDFAASLQFARLWNSAGYDGQRVDRHHVLVDKDVVEFHI